MLTAVKWSPVFDGAELNLQNISNLTIEGSGMDKTELRVVPRFANIIRFKNSSNITIMNLKAGHTPAEYECNEGVLEFEACQHIKISSSELYGCGSTGITLYDSFDLSCDNSLIDHCSLRALYFRNSFSIKFTKTRLVNHEAYASIITASESKMWFLRNVKYQTITILNGAS